MTLSQDEAVGRLYHPAPYTYYRFNLQTNGAYGGIVTNPETVYAAMYEAIVEHDRKAGVD